MNQFKSRTTLTELRRWVELPGSVYYYKPKEGKPGRKPSTHTLRSGDLTSNSQVVEDIKAILSQPYVCYGYENVTVELRRIDYYINEKKVYR